jgi:hypothetical protein
MIATAARAGRLSTAFGAPKPPDGSLIGKLPNEQLKS